jgi:membrane protease YdiL (CAAX protease family)
MQKPKYHFWIFLLAFYLTWIFRATWFYSRVDLAIPDSTGRLLFSAGIKFVLWVLPAVVYILWHDRQNPLLTMKITTRIAPSGLLIGVLLSALYFACILLYAYLISHQTLASLLRASTATLLGTLPGVLFSPLYEELFFRGLVLPTLNASLRFWPANLLQAVLFTAIHWPNWLWLGGFHASLLITSVSILLLGLFFGWLTRRTNSIWPAVAMHMLNNFLAAFLG